jgi:hypothetical protein
MKYAKSMFFLRFSIAISRELIRKPPYLYIHREIRQPKIWKDFFINSLSYLAKSFCGSSPLLSVTQNCTPEEGKKQKKTISFQCQRTSYRVIKE